MERKVGQVMMGLGFLAGLMIGSGYTGGGVALAVAASAAAWLMRRDARHGDHA